MRGAATVSLLLMTLTVANATIFTIFWNSGSNYTHWASDKHFFVGDWLKFVFNKYQYSVLEVNRTNYENCIESNFITNITKGGRDVFQLNQTRPYYFISGFGQCWGGVKLSINVEPISPPVSPSPLTNASPLPNSSVSLFMFIVLAISFILLDA